MSDRVPICTFPGLVSQLVDQDRMVAPADVAKLITRVFLQRTDDEAGDEVVAAIHNATGGGGDKIEVTIASGESEAAASGSITVEASEPTYLRVSAADSNSQNLSGWFQVDGTAGVTVLLTSFALVEQWLDDNTGQDDLINNLVARVSGEIQSWLRRKIIRVDDEVEKIDSIGDTRICTRHSPIIEIGSLTESGSALVEDTGFECTAADKLSGSLVRLSGGYPTAWAAGERVVTVTYDHGYANVPEEITAAATELVAWDYYQSPASKQGRFGLTGAALDTGGTSTYTTREQLWEAQKPRLSPYRRAWL